MKKHTLNIYFQKQKKSVLQNNLAYIKNKKRTDFSALLAERVIQSEIYKQTKHKQMKEINVPLFVILTYKTKSVKWCYSLSKLFHSTLTTQPPTKAC